MLRREGLRDTKGHAGGVNTWKFLIVIIRNLESTKKMKTPKKTQAFNPLFFVVFEGRGDLASKTRTHRPVVKDQ